METKTNLTVRVDSRIRASLEATAKERGWLLSEVVRDALLRHAENYRRHLLFELFAMVHRCKPESMPDEDVTPILDELGMMTDKQLVAFLETSPGVIRATINQTAEVLRNGGGLTKNVVDQWLFGDATEKELFTKGMDSLDELHKQ